MQTIVNWFLVVSEDPWNYSQYLPDTTGLKLPFSMQDLIQFD